MRKTVITLLALGLFAATTASAASFWGETFTYANGDLTTVATGIWFTHSGTLPTDVQVLAGEAVLTSTNAPDDNRQFSPARGATDATYACFKLKISGTQTASGTYFAHLMNTGTFFGARVFAMLNDATTYKLGISTTSTTPVGTAIWPTMLTKGVYYNVAIKYDAATGISTMWVDPGTEASPSVVSLVGPTGTLISGFALRQSAGYGVATIDDVGVGATFEDACYVVPTPTSSSTWGKLKSLYR
jgi:hypothetical protein